MAASTAAPAAMAAVTIVAAVVALAAALYAFATGRRTAAALARVEAARTAAGQGPLAPTARLDDLERRWLNTAAQARAAGEGVAEVRERLAGVEARLDDLGRATAPPPIPSGRSVARLEALRAALRAQAAEAAAAAEAGNAPAPAGPDRGA